MLLAHLHAPLIVYSNVARKGSRMSNKRKRTGFQLDQLLEAKLNKCRDESILASSSHECSPKFGRCELCRLWFDSENEILRHLVTEHPGIVTINRNIQLNSPSVLAIPTSSANETDTTCKHPTTSRYSNKKHFASKNTVNQGMIHTSSNHSYFMCDQCSSTFLHDFEFARHVAQEHGSTIHELSESSGTNRNHSFNQRPSLLSGQRKTIKRNMQQQPTGNDERLSQYSQRQFATQQQQQQLADSAARFLDLAGSTALLQHLMTLAATSITNSNKREVESPKTEDHTNILLSPTLPPTSTPDVKFPLPCANDAEMEEEKVENEYKCSSADRELHCESDGLRDVEQLNSAITNEDGSDIGRCELSAFHSDYFRSLIQSNVDNCRRYV